MNTANIPGFVAEKAIYRSRRLYRTAASSAAFHVAHDGQAVLPAVPVPVDEPGSGGTTQFGCGRCTDGWQQCTWPNESYRQACTSCGDYAAALTGQLTQTCRRGNSTFTQPCQVCFDIPLPWPIPDTTLCINSLNPIDITVP
jgi:hypothetical protein